MMKKLFPDSEVHAVDISNDAITLAKENAEINNLKVDFYQSDLLTNVEKLDFDLINKTAFVLGAGGVVPSIIYALVKMGVSKILISNRTESKAENIKKLFNNLQIFLYLPLFKILLDPHSTVLDSSID